MTKVKLLDVTMFGSKVHDAGSIIEVTPQHAQELINKKLAKETDDSVSEKLIDQSNSKKGKKSGNQTAQPLVNEPEITTSEESKVDAGEKSKSSTEN